MMEEMLNITVYVIPEADEKLLTIFRRLVADAHVTEIKYVSQMDAYQAE